MEVLPSLEGKRQSDLVLVAVMAVCRRLTIVLAWVVSLI
jgi:hypothetical protein